MKNILIIVLFFAATLENFAQNTEWKNALKSRDNLLSVSKVPCLVWTKNEIMQQYNSGPEFIFANHPEFQEIIFWPVEIKFNSVEYNNDSLILNMSLFYGADLVTGFEIFNEESNMRKVFTQYNPETLQYVFRDDVPYWDFQFKISVEEQNHIFNLILNRGTSYEFPHIWTQEIFFSIQGGELEVWHIDPFLNEIDPDMWTNQAYKFKKK